MVTPEMDDWLKTTILNATPEDFGYDTPLGTCDLLSELLSHRYNIQVIGATVGHHLKHMQLSYQQPR